MPFTFLTAPVTSATGILLTVDKAEVPFPMTYPFRLVAPVPPLATSTTPVTFPAFPEILPVTFPPEILDILSLLMAPLAMSTVAMVPSNIFVLEIAPVLIVGKLAVPPRSPANFNFPAVEAVASVMVAEAT